MNRESFWKEFLTNMAGVMVIFAMFYALFILLWAVQ